MAEHDHTWKLLVATADEYHACLRLYRAARVHTAWPDARTLLCVDDGSECLVWLTTLDWPALWIISRGARSAEPWAYLLGFDLLDSPETADAYNTLTGEDAPVWTGGGIPGTSQDTRAYRVIVATLASMPEMEAVGGGRWRDRTYQAATSAWHGAPLGVPATGPPEQPPTPQTLAPPRRQTRAQSRTPRTHTTAESQSPVLVSAAVEPLAGRCATCLRRAQHCTCNQRSGRT